MENNNVVQMSLCQSSIQKLEQNLNECILGQPELVNRMLIALLADGHLLVEGAPGLAKTKAIRALAQFIEGDFHRIQFTPDLLPGDLTGTDIYRPETGNFNFQPGPIFHHLLLADEINRAPAKVQSALLEAMAERQVTIGRKTYELPNLFMVMATQNPIEQEGTYPLPEAQLDRFLLHVKVEHPRADTEAQILKLAREEARQGQVHFESKQAIISQDTLLKARKEILDLYLSPALEQYIVQLVVTTRDPSKYSENLSSCIRYGASPRATIALERCARAHAWLAKRDFVAPEDVQAIARDVLRHRILLSYEAEAEGYSTDDIVNQILQLVAVP